MTNKTQGTSLAIQWLRLHASAARGMGSASSQGPKIPQAVWPKNKERMKAKVSGKTREGEKWEDSRNRTQKPKEVKHELGMK